MPAQAGRGNHHFVLLATKTADRPRECREIDRRQECIQVRPLACCLVCITAEYKKTKRMVLSEDSILSQLIEAQQVSGRIQNELRPNIFLDQPVKKFCRRSLRRWVGAKLAQAERYRFRAERLDHRHLLLRFVLTDCFGRNLDDQPFSHPRANR